MPSLASRAKVTGMLLGDADIEATRRGKAIVEFVERAEGIAAVIATMRSSARPRRSGLGKDIV